MKLWFVLTCVLWAGSALADPCAEMVALHKQHLEELDKLDSDPRALNALMEQFIRSLGPCIAAIDEDSDEINAAVDALARPVFVVPAKNIRAEEPEYSSGAYRFELFANIPDYGEVDWGVVSMPCEMQPNKQCFPTAGVPTPDMVIYTRTALPDGRKIKIRIKGQEEVRLSATRVALKLMHDNYMKVYKKPLEENHADLDQLNLLIFQKAFAELRYKKGRSEKDAKDAAILKTPAAKHRLKAPFNYTVITVDIDDFVPIEFKLPGDDKAVEYSVPKKVHMVAKGRRL